MLFFSKFFRLFVFFFIHGLESHANAFAVGGSSVAKQSADALSLLDFKLMVADPSEALRSWNGSLHFCSWEGIACDPRHGRVTRLDLTSKGLVGLLSPSLGNLSFLEYFSIPNNNFVGRIPNEFGRLSRLKSLVLTNNSFHGEIPKTLSNCSELVNLHLGGNKLVGNIPIDIFSISSLKVLRYFRNNITGGMPPAIGNLTSLEILSVASNQLGGSIPSSIGRLKNLKMLGIGANGLSGSLPSSIYNLSLLEVFSFPNNRLNGSLSPSMGHSLPKLQLFQMEMNHFTGSIPPSLSNISSLKHVSLNTNNFSGKLRVDFGGMKSLSELTFDENNLGSGDMDELNFLGSLTNCTQLSWLTFSLNSFQGVLPSSFANLSTQIQLISLGSNRLFGNVPSGIGNLVGLNILGFEQNNFIGTIPSDIGKLLNLQSLTLGGNALSGEIPATIGNLSRLITLGLEHNRFGGSIPMSIENCRELSEISVSHNFFNGSIPKQVFSLSKLGAALDLSQNKFSGDLPVEVGSLKVLTLLDLSDNELSGNIPSALGGCTSLEYLDMKRNYFNGSIPSSFRSLRGVRYLDLSNNNLSGQIPVFLSTFDMIFLNLSFNKLEGEIPLNGVFSNASVVSLLGNDRLCGGITALRLPNCTHGEHKRPKSTKLRKVIVLTCVSLLVLAVILFSLFCLVIKKKKKKKKIDTPYSLPLDPLFLEVSYGDLRKATDDFSSENLIGRGYFSSVYKGYLEKVGETVAVKVINLQNHGAIDSFASECVALKNIRHRNLLKTITSCSSIDFQGNDFKAIVYEFMPNGSLHSWLHIDIDGREGRLNFLQRLNIAIDLALGLDYLHNHCHIPIVHCDLKPSNVLLDGEMTAHIGDFGLAKLIPEITNYTDSSSMGIRGTIGYAAPEYAQGSAVSVKGDIYSYGILLLEMVTGRSPTDELFMEGLDLHGYAEKALSIHVTDIVDPLLIPQREGDKNKIINCLVSMVKLGVACSVTSARDRMDLEVVQRELIMVKNSLLASNF